MVVDVEMDVEQALPEVDGEVEVTAYEGMAMESACCSKDLRAVVGSCRYGGRGAGAAARESNKSLAMESIEPIRMWRIKSSWSGENSHVREN